MTTTFLNRKMFQPTSTKLKVYTVNSFLNTLTNVTKQPFLFNRGYEFS